MDEKFYKYYLYYYENDIYAYTDDKDIKETFESQRNMNKLKRKSIKISKAGVNYFAKEYQQLYLRYKMIEIYDKESNEYYPVNFALTGVEILNLTHVEMSSMIELCSICFHTNPSIFNKELYKALEDLGYIQIYNCAYNLKKVNSAAECLIFDIENGSINMKLNEFRLLVNSIGKILKG